MKDDQEKTIETDGKKIVNNIVSYPGRNGGTLTAGNPGNKGGAGRPPNEIRALARKGLAFSVPALNKLAAAFYRELEDAERIENDGERVVKLNSISRSIEQLIKINAELRQTGLPSQTEDVTEPSTEEKIEAVKLAVAKLLGKGSE